MREEISFRYVGRRCLFENKIPSGWLRICCLNFFDDELFLGEYIAEISGNFFHYTILN